MKRLTRGVVKGDRVLIFQMPFTEEQEEGWASVVKMVDKERYYTINGSCMREIRAMVRFDGETETFLRTIIGDPIIEK